MSDVILIGIEVVEPSGAAPSGFPENLVDSWIEDTEPSPRTEDVGIASAIKIKFKKSLDTTLTSNANFELHSPSGNQVSDPFLDINFAYDYNSIARILYLKPINVLNPLSQYTVVVKDLVDAGGNSMTEEHYWSFNTGVGPSGVLFEDYPEPDIDVVLIEDYAPQYPTISGYLPTNITSSPYSGQIGIASGFAGGLITIDYGAVVDTSLITVKSEDWSSPGSFPEFVSVTITQTTGGVVSIQLPEDPTGSGIYFKPNNAYYIDAIYSTISFTGVLSPMYASPTVVMGMLGDSYDSIEAARSMYFTSLEIDAMSALWGQYAENLARDNISLMQLALYMSLYRATSISSGEDFQLGQLRITDSASINTNNPYYGPLMYWRKKVFGGFSPKQVQTIDRESHDFLRSWSVSRDNFPRTYTGRSPRSWL